MREQKKQHTTFFMRKNKNYFYGHGFNSYVSHYQMLLAIVKPLFHEQHVTHSGFDAQALVHGEEHSKTEQLAPGLRL